jgi:hypothetical protein
MNRECGRPRRHCSETPAQGLYFGLWLSGYPLQRVPQHARYGEFHQPPTQVRSATQQILNTARWLWDGTRSNVGCSAVTRNGGAYVGAFMTSRDQDVLEWLCIRAGEYLEQATALESAAPQAAPVVHLGQQLESGTKTRPPQVFVKRRPSFKT